VEPKLRIWLVFNHTTKLGGGRAELLRLVDQLGSLKGAVARLGMSYRAAWGYLRELEQAAGFRLIEPVGAARGSGARLTPEGRDLLTGYERFQMELESVAADRFRAIFAAKKAGSGPRRRSSPRKPVSPRG